MLQTSLSIQMWSMKSIAWFLPARYISCRPAPVSPLGSDLLKSFLKPIFIVKLVNLLFSVCFATGYIHSGEIKIFKVYTRTKRYYSFIGLQYGLNHYRQTYFLAMLSIWLFVLLLAILYDHMIMYVGLLSHSAVVFHVFLCFFMLLCFTDCVVAFFQWHFIDLFSCIAASLFNKLTYLLLLIWWWNVLLHSQEEEEEEERLCWTAQQTRMTVL